MSLEEKLEILENLVTGSWPLPDIKTALFEYYPDALLITSADGVILAANGLAKELTGYSALVGMCVEDLIEVDTRATHRMLRREYAQAPVLRPMGLGLIVPLLRKSGIPISVEIMLNPATFEGTLYIILSIRTARREAICQ